MAGAWLSQILDDAATYLTTQAGAMPALAYLGRRAVPDQDILRYRVGFLPADYLVQSCPPEFVSWQKRALRRRLIFPITSALGHPVGLTTRALDEHSYETFYAASRDVYPPVFGLGPAADALYAQRQVILVEGVFDLFAVRAATGFDHVLATLTANTSRAVEKLLRRYVERVVCLYDMDEPGRTGVRRIQGWYQRQDGTWAAPKTPPPYQVVSPEYPSHDPSDWVTTGTQALATLLRDYATPYEVLS